MVLVVVDDDPLSLAAMKDHFGSLGLLNKAYFFGSPIAFEAFLVSANRDELFVFSDFDLKAEINGLGLIARHQLEHQAALVTACTKERIQEETKGHGIPVYNKKDLGALKIEMVG